MPEFNPYDVTVDKNDEAWAVTEFSDALLRVNTKTEKWWSIPCPELRTCAVHLSTIRPHQLRSGWATPMPPQL